MSRELEVLIKHLESLGFVRDKSKHNKLYAPKSKRPIVIASTPSDKRGWKNTIAYLRREYGLQWPPKSKKELKSLRRKRKKEGDDG